jgi:translation initiation factor IF-3
MFRVLSRKRLVKASEKQQVIFLMAYGVYRYASQRSTQSPDHRRRKYIESKNQMRLTIDTNISKIKTNEVDTLWSEESLNFQGDWKCQRE